MKASCRKCKNLKAIEKMKRERYPVLNEKGKEIPMANQYYYYCDEKCTQPL